MLISINYRKTSLFAFLKLVFYLVDITFVLYQGSNFDDSIMIIDCSFH